MTQDIFRTLSNITDEGRVYSSIIGGCLIASSKLKKTNQFPNVCLLPPPLKKSFYKNKKRSLQLQKNHETFTINTN